jgi:hypothetical protein
VTIVDCRIGQSQQEFVPEADLQKPTRHFREKLRQALDIRFPFDGKSSGSDVAAARYGLAAYLDPRFRDLKALDVPDAFVEKVKTCVRSRLEGELKPLLADLRQAYNSYTAKQRGPGVRSEGQGPTKRVAGEQGSLAFLDVIQLRRERREASAPGAAPAASRNPVDEQEGPHVATPTEIIQRIVAAEIEAYEAQPSVAQDTDVLQWWREHITTLPVLSLVAARTLVIPASSGEHLVSSNHLT